MDNNRRKRLWIPEAPHLMLTRTREMEVNGPTLGVAGYFDVELVHASTGRVKKSLRFKNQITKAGLSTLAGGAALNGTSLTSDGTGLLSWLGVGTGNTPPTSDDVALESPTRFLENVSDRTDDNGGFAQTVVAGGTGDNVSHYDFTRTRVFPTHLANGNLAELGIFEAGGNAIYENATMWCRQLFRDAVGNPTTFTKTSEDILRVRYTLRVVPQPGDVQDTVSIGGNLYDTTSRAYGAAANAGANYLGSLHGRGTNHVVYADQTLQGRGSTSTPSGPSSLADSVEYRKAGETSRECETVYGASKALHGVGLAVIRFHWGSGYQIRFDPIVPKTDTQRLLVTARVNYVAA